MIGILIYGFIFILGILAGFLLKTRLVHRLEDASGTIFVRRDSASKKVVYSLELDDYPETLQLKKVVIFNVDTSG